MTVLNGKKQRRLRFLTVFFFSALALLIVQTAMNVKDINDGWILEGIWPYFVLLALSYGSIVCFSSNLKLVAIASAIYLATVNLLPNLKYVFIYGYHDPLLHYASIRDTTMLGYASGIGPYATQYEATPATHILASALSTVTGMNTATTMKALLTAAPFMIPLVIYLVAKRIPLPSGLAKATLAATVIVSPLMYTYFGAGAVYPIYILFTFMFLLAGSLKEASRSTAAILILLGLAILVSHDVTSLMLLAYMFSFLLAKKMPRMLRSRFSENSSRGLPVPLILVFIVMILGHFLFSSLGNFTRFLMLGSELLAKLASAQGPAALSSYETFYTLSPLEMIRTFLARFGNYVISILLVSLAPLAYAKLSLSKKPRAFYQSLMLPLFLAALVFLGLLFLRPYVHREFYVYSFLPFFAGLSVFYVSRLKPKFRKAVLLLLICAFALLSCLATYPLQPIVPTVSKGQSTYYVFDARAVNTIYDRSLISFASAHNNKSYVWADDIMVTQIYGLADSSLYSMLKGNPYKSQVLLISHTERSHANPSGRNAIIMEGYLQECLRNASTLYTNGFSYAFWNITAATIP